MKKQYILLALGMLGYQFSKAQITITENDLTPVGLHVVQNSSDDKVLIPAGGTNKTWNFTGMSVSSVDTLKFGAAGWFPGYQNFPTANIGVGGNAGDSSYTYLHKSSSVLELVGSYEIVNGTGTASDVGFKLLTLPATYNTSFKDTFTFPQDPFELGIDPDGGGPLPTIDSVEVIINLFINSIADGWGSLTTPLGTKNAIRVNHMRRSALTARINVSGFWVDAPQVFIDSFFGNGNVDTTNQHFYWTNDANIGFPLLSYTYSQGNDSADNVTWLAQTPVVSSVKTNVISKVSAFPNPATGKVFVQLPKSVLSTEIFDIAGRKVYSTHEAGLVEINISSWENGNYFIKSIDKNGMLSTGAFVKN